LHPQARRLAPILLACALGLCGCASVSEKVTEGMSGLPGVGLPAGTPERPATPVAYPAVHDMPPARPASLLNEVEQQKLEDDLVAARDRQQAAAGTAPPATSSKKKTRPTTPAATAVPATSSRTIY
jgi:hypothetical protein